MTWDPLSQQEENFWEGVRERVEKGIFLLSFEEEDDSDSILTFQEKGHNTRQTERARVMQTCMMCINSDTFMFDQREEKGGEKMMMMMREREEKGKRTEQRIEREREDEMNQFGRKRSTFKNLSAWKAWNKSRWSSCLRLSYILSHSYFTAQVSLFSKEVLGITINLFQDILSPGIEWGGREGTDH